MTKVSSGILIIEPEEPSKCELYGNTAELRPYGPNKENICYKCGMKDKAATNRAIEERFGKIQKTRIPGPEKRNLN